MVGEVTGWVGARWPCAILGCIWGRESQMVGAGLDFSCDERLDHDLCPAMDEKRGGHESWREIPSSE